MGHIIKEDSGVYKDSRSYLASPKVQRHKTEDDHSWNGATGEGSDSCS